MEMCFQRTKNFDKLSFLYLITGGAIKLSFNTSGCTQSTAQPSGCRDPSIADPIQARALHPSHICAEHEQVRRPSTGSQRPRRSLIKVGPCKQRSRRSSGAFRQ
ncbi:MAG: hypothetical protein ACK55Z_33590, partial [bacterium]